MDDLLIFALIVTVAGAALLFYTLQGNPKKKSQPPPAAPHPTLTSTTSDALEISTSFLHTLQMPSYESAQRLLKALNDKGIEAAVYAKGNIVKVQFTADKPLKNAEELKNKGLIKDYEISEVINNV